MKDKTISIIPINNRYVRGINKDQKVERMLYCQYRSGAVKRNLDFLLTEDDFYPYLHKPCQVCKRINVNRISYSDHTSYLDYNGIDRIDNDIGYVLGNLRTLCGDCNKAKSAMGNDRFEKWIEAIRSTKHDQ